MTKTTLAFHGSLGNSRSHSLLWVPSSTITDNDNTQQQGSCDEATVVYASAGGVVNLASSTYYTTACLGNDAVTSVNSLYLH